MSDVTKLLNAYRDGDQPTDELITSVYDELRRIARRQLSSEKPGQTLQATALVHEAYVRLFGDKRNWENRRHFFAAAAEVMRYVIVDRARRKSAQKRGAGLKRDALDPIDLPAPLKSQDVISLDDALKVLEDRDPAAAELVKLRFYVGMTVRDAGEAMEISVRTANRMWEYARAFLRREMLDG